MKVFISWSGQLSGQIATLLSSWIGDVIQGVNTWVSSEDIEKGSIWFGDIGNGLAETDFGVLCLTRENLSAPWILFEAGALSKRLTKARVCPLLINLDHAEVRPPLSHFNGTRFTKDDMLKLVGTINVQLGNSALDSGRLQRSFDRCWPEFEQKFIRFLDGYTPSKEVHRRPPEEMIEETLELTRSIHRTLQNEKDLAWLNRLARPEHFPPGNLTMDDLVNPIVGGAFSRLNDLISRTSGPSEVSTDHSLKVDPPKK